MNVKMLGLDRSIAVGRLGVIRPEHKLEPDMSVNARTGIERPVSMCDPFGELRL